MHPVLVLQQMSRVEAVLPSRARHDTIVPPVSATVSIAQGKELSVSVLPVDPISLQPGVPTGITLSLRVEVDRYLLRVSMVCVFDGGIRALVGHHTRPAEAHLGRKPVLSFQTFRSGSLSDVRHAAHPSSRSRLVTLTNFANCL